MDYTTDWFTHNVPVWSGLLKDQRGQPGLRYLEIGSYEGRATCWLLENILTGEGSRIDCIDTFEGGMESAPQDADMANVRQRFEANTGPWRQRVNLHVGLSSEILPGLNGAFDCIYIDGSHLARDVLFDAVLSWRLLKDGGILLFDDYEWQLLPEPWQRPKLAIDAFAACYHGWHEVLHIGYQVALRKLGTYTSP